MPGPLSSACLALFLCSLAATSCQKKADEHWDDRTFEVLEQSERRQHRIAQLERENAQLKAALATAAQKQAELAAALSRFQQGDTQADHRAKLATQERDNSQQLLSFCRERLHAVEQENLTLRDRPEQFYEAALRNLGRGDLESVQIAKQQLNTILSRYPLFHMRAEVEQRLKDCEKRLLAATFKEQKRQELVENSKLRNEDQKRFGTSISCADLFIPVPYPARVNFRAAIANARLEECQAALWCEGTAKSFDATWSAEVLRPNHQAIKAAAADANSRLFIGKPSRRPDGSPLLEIEEILP